MEERQHAFGQIPYNLLDNLIFWLRKRQVTRYFRATTGTIVDLGSGFDCRLLCALLEQSPSLRGIAVDSAFDSRLATDRLQLITADLNQPLPTISSETATTVISLAVLEHLTEPEVFLAEIYRILKPGGMLLLTTPGPTAQPLLEFLAYRLGVIDAHEIRDHKHYYSPAELVAGLSLAGFPRTEIIPKTFIFGMNNLVIATKE